MQIKNTKSRKMKIYCKWLSRILPKVIFILSPPKGKETTLLYIFDKIENFQQKS